MATDQSRTAPWWRDVTAHQWGVFAIASAAWLFDILDQRIFSVVRIPALSALMDLPGGEARAVKIGRLSLERTATEPLVDPVHVARIE
jgi:hypothetical protein